MKRFRRDRGLGVKKIPRPSPSLIFQHTCNRWFYFTQTRFELKLFYPKNWVNCNKSEFATVATVEIQTGWRIGEEWATSDCNTSIKATILWKNKFYLFLKWTVNMKLINSHKCYPTHFLDKNSITFCTNFTQAMNKFTQTMFMSSHAFASLVFSKW